MTSCRAMCQSDSRSNGDTDFDCRVRTEWLWEAPGWKALIAQRVQAEANDSLDELGIGEPGFEGGLGKVFVGGEDRVGIGLDKVDFIVGGHPEVDAGVAIDG